MSSSMAERPAWATWLEKRYLEWQVGQGRRRSIGDLAEWIEQHVGSEASVNRSTLVRYMNGQRRPRRETAYLLAAAFGDTGIFPAIGQIAPTLTECRLFAVMRNGRMLPEAMMARLAALAGAADGEGKRLA